MKLLSFVIVNFGFPQSLENMVYDFRSFKLLVVINMSQVPIELSPPPPPPRARMGGGEIAQLIQLL